VYNVYVLFIDVQINTVINTIGSSWSSSDATQNFVTTVHNLAQHPYLFILIFFSNRVPGEKFWQTGSYPNCSLPTETK